MRGGWVERGTVLIRLGRAHFAFFRGYLDGLDVGDLAARYLTAQLPSSRTDARPDLRLAKSAVKWIRAQLLVLARRSLAPAEVRLLALAPALLVVEYGREAPALDEFRQEHDADGMYGEAELIVLYEQAHGDRSAVAERRAARNGRLRQRQQQALNRLEAVTAADPQPADRVDTWLDPLLAMRLHAVGVDHLADLVALIDRHGYRWYRKVPRIGIKAALQIGRWLQDESVRTIPGLQPAGRPYQPPRSLSTAAPAAPRTAIVALEYFCMPSEPADCLADAEPAAARAQAALPELPEQPEQPTLQGLQALQARPDDVATINRWLCLKPRQGHTWRAYRKEAERLLLWTVLERGKTLRTLNAEDCAAYREFLALIGTTDERRWRSLFRLPQAAWIGTPGTARESRFWRPFHGPLGLPSQRQAWTILKGLLAWLADQGYVPGNPMHAVSANAGRNASDRSLRLLNQAEWQAIRGHLNRQPASWTNDRLRCVLALAAGAGLRLAELAALRRQQVQVATPADQHGAAWTLHLTDVRGNARTVALDDAVMAEVTRYFKRRGFTNVASAPADTPVIAALAAKLPAAASNAAAYLTVEAGLTVDRIHRIVKCLFQDVARRYAVDDPAMAARLRSASLDWLRRSAGSPFTLE